MNTEFERISEIMYTLLAHQPVIDVPYEKINDIAVALVKEGYGKISEYETEIEPLKAERKMLGSKIKVLEQRLNNKYIEVDNLNRDYRNAFERLKAQEREIERLKANGYRSITDAFEDNHDKIVENIQTEIDDYKQSIKQAQIDVLNKVKDIVFDYLGVKNIKEAEALSLLDSTLTYDVVTCGIDELIKEVQDE